jgi:hypothetical protein
MARENDGMGNAEHRARTVVHDKGDDAALGEVLRLQAE